MAYNANGNISIAEWSEVKKLVNDLSRTVNQELDKIGTDTVNALRENVAANKEITPLEIQQMWGN